MILEHETLLRNLELFVPFSRMLYNIFGRFLNAILLTKFFMLNAVLKATKDHLRFSDFPTSGLTILPALNY